MEDKEFKEFLESVPPGKYMLVNHFHVHKLTHYLIAKPELQLHCTTEECQGIRFFEAIGNDRYLTTDAYRNISTEYNNTYVQYACRNCRKSVKTFALGAGYDKEIKKWNVMKYGEVPSFGPPIPTRVFNLIGKEKELFLLGRRSENQGMGIGAFVYYRRVIESQKNRIFDELTRVIKKISPDNAVLGEIEAAKSETQFTKAVESIKHALPQSLNINGYNPLRLLHSALSEGVHDHTDDECLELASSIRTVLFAFTEILGQALKEEKELIEAVNKLAHKKSEKSLQIPGEQGTEGE